MRELLIKWLREGLKLTTGEELYIPADSKQAQEDMYKSLRKELTILKHIEPEEAVKLRIFTTYKDSQFWCGIKKISVTSLVAFKKGIDGNICRVTIDNDRDEQRIKRLKEASNASK